MFLWPFLLVSSLRVVPCDTTNKNEIPRQKKGEDVTCRGPGVIIAWLYDFFFFAVCTCVHRRRCHFQHPPPPHKPAVVYQSNMAALLRETRIFYSRLRAQFSSHAKRFRPPYIETPHYPGRLISRHHITPAALYRDTSLPRPPYIGTPHYPGRLISRHHTTPAALYRDTTLPRPPYIGTPHYPGRLISGHHIAPAALYRDTDACYDKGSTFLLFWFFE